jgi:carboxypeptidase C (cathepsin A)
MIKPGHYIPQLAQVMAEFNRKQENIFNLKGIAVND